MRRSRCLLVLFFAGCATSSDDNTALSVESRSGTRLQVEVLETAEGFRQFSRFYDTELEVPCTFARATDAKLRCLPDVARGSLYYRDPACEAQPMAAYYSAEPVSDLSRFIFTELWNGSQTCRDYLPFEEQIWQRSDEALLDTITVDGEVMLEAYAKDPQTGACQPRPFWPGDVEAHYFDLTAPDLEMFVEATVAYGSLGGSRLQEAYLQGKDGSIGPLAGYYEMAAVYDSTLLTRVEHAPLATPIDAKGGTVFWTSALGYVIPWGYRDEACSEHNVTVDIGASCEAKPGSVAADWFAAECVVQPKYYEIGESLAQSYYRDSDEDACEREDANAIEITYALGGEADLASLVSGELAYESFGRLSLEVVHNADGSRVPVGIWDEELGQACRFAEGPFGNVRCEPDINSAATYFLQSDCTEPVMLVDPCSPRQDIVEDPATDTWTRLVGGEELPRSEVPALYTWVAAWGECISTGTSLDSWPDALLLRATAVEPITLVEAQRVRR